MDEAAVDRLLAEQRRYYRERANEYDDWWFRRAGYALDTETEDRWFADVRELEAELDAFGPRGDVLELAAGTGIWTRRLLWHADRVTAVDAVAEVLELNRARTTARSTTSSPTSSSGSRRASSTSASSGSGTRTCRAGSSRRSGNSWAGR
jgi:SAM-dependent methyltransferase